MSKHSIILFSFPSPINIMITRSEPWQVEITKWNKENLFKKKRKKKACLFFIFLLRHLDDRKKLQKWLEFTPRSIGVCGVLEFRNCVDEKSEWNCININISNNKLNSINKHKTTSFRAPAVFSLTTSTESSSSSYQLCLFTCFRRVPCDPVGLRALILILEKKSPKLDLKISHYWLALVCLMIIFNWSLIVNVHP